MIHLHISATFGLANGGRIRRALTTAVSSLALTAFWSPHPVLGQALPTGGRVVSGTVSVGPSGGGALTITQSSPTAIVNWQSFSVGSGGRVEIRQPGAGAALLNRVTGATPSTIAGRIRADGQVYLVNPHGIAITASGSVEAGGGFVASSLDIADRDFAAGGRTFAGTGASAAVTNEGTITVGRGGYAALLGGRVGNGGTITVPLGRVGLGAGERAALDLSGDGFLQVAVPTQAPGEGALVSSAGAIRADGGRVTLSAAAARAMARRAVNLSGTVEARAVGGRSGDIVLSGGEGTVEVTGRLDASGSAGSAGGRVRITGRRVGVGGAVTVSGGTGGRVSVTGTEAATLSGRVSARGTSGPGGRVEATAPELTLRGAALDASGATGGGVVHLGGGRRGGGGLARAQRVTVDAGTAILADAEVSGAGGEVVVWSDAATAFAGTITARGGAAGGDGGAAEVSSQGHLAYAGRTDLTAARGAFGTLLLDPHDVTISTDADTTSSGFTATGDNSVINATTLLTALGTANVTVSTGVGGTQTGTITLAANTPLSWKTSATLILQAAGGITLNSDISAPAGALALSSGGTITPNAAVSVARFVLTQGDWVQNSATLPAFATADFQLSGGTFLRVTGGDGSWPDPYQLADVYGLQGVGATSNYVLVQDIDASGTATWNAGQGFLPIASGSTPFVGILRGQSHMVTGLTINRPTADDIGLFGHLGSGGAVRNLGVVDAKVTGRNNVGALVGSNDGSVNAGYATGIVNGSTVGGLVGANSGTVTNSYSEASVTGKTAGGLIGLIASNGSATDVYATGTVTSVSGSSAGGLAGANSGQITRGYASGLVRGAGANGGVSGEQGGTTTDVFWDTETTEQGNARGDGGAGVGAQGLTSAEARTSAPYTHFDFVGTWYQADGIRPILRAEAATVNDLGWIAIRNAHQLQLMGAGLYGNYSLDRNIDASDTAGTSASAGIWGDKGFVPVGTAQDRFKGTFDGQNHQIKELSISSTADYAGLFGISISSIKNVGLTGGIITGTKWVGAIAGRNLGIIEGSYATSDVSATDTDGVAGGLVGLNTGTINSTFATGAVYSTNISGGLVGQNEASVTIKYSYSSGNVQGSHYAGGLVGVNLGTVKLAYALGTVSASQTDGYAGGLFGKTTGTVNSVYATGKSTAAYAGGIAGYGEGTIGAAYWDKDTSTNPYAYASYSGYGYSTPSGAYGLSTTDARTIKGYIPAANANDKFDFTNDWYQWSDSRPILRKEAAQADASGTIPIGSLHQLQLINLNLNGSYRLTTDIDATATKGSANSSDIWGDSGFYPIGPLVFHGSIDGAGHTIKSLTINLPQLSHVGLVGQLGSDGKINDIALVDGNVVGHDDVGMLAGYSYGKILHAWATGKVTGTLITGGLVGLNDVSGSIATSFANVGITNSQAQAGGFVGSNLGTISNAYALGNVDGTDVIGGFVGQNTGVIDQTYSVGKVSMKGGSNIRIGGFVGSLLSGTIKNSYWNNVTSQQTKAAGQGVATGAKGLSTDQMQSSTDSSQNYSGFDFEDTWSPPNAANQGGLSEAHYPELYSLSHVVVVNFDSQTLYGSAVPTNLMARYRGVQAGDFVTSVGTIVTGAGQKDVGQYPAEISGVTVSGPSSYRLLSSGLVTILPAPLSVTGDKAYDGTTQFTAAQLKVDGAMAGEMVTLTAGNADASASDAGTYDGSTLTNLTITVTNGKASNYSLPSLGKLTIARRMLSIVGAKTYDGTPSFSLENLSASGAVGSETITLTAGSAGAAFSGVGTDNLGTLTGLDFTVSGGSKSNYELPLTAALTISKRQLLATLQPVTKTYDGQEFSGGAGVEFSGFVGSDSSAVVSGSMSFGGNSQGARTAGVYEITGSGLAATNYSIAYVPTTLTINKARLFVTARDAAKTYDGHAFGGGNGVEYSGFVAGDDAKSLRGTLEFTGTSQGVLYPGQYTLTPTGLSADNYSISYQSGTLTVSKAPLTITARNASRAYNGREFLGGNDVDFQGFVEGEDASHLYGSLTFGNTSQHAKNVGTYIISPSGLLSEHYAITFKDGSLTITPAPVVVTAASGTSVYGSTAVNPGLTATGLVDGEEIGVLTGLSNSFGITARTDVAGSPYPLTVTGTLTNGNYAVIERRSGTWTVTPRAISVSATAASRPFGEANPVLGYVAVGFVNDDGIWGSLATEANATSPVGTYAITQGSLTAGSNYTISYTGADLTVTASAASGSGGSQPSQPGGGPNPSSGTGGATNPSAGYAGGSANPSTGTGGGTNPSAGSAGGSANPSTGTGGGTNPSAGSAGGSANPSTASGGGSSQGIPGSGTSPSPTTGAGGSSDPSGSIGGDPVQSGTTATVSATDLASSVALSGILTTSQIPTPTPLQVMQTQDGLTIASDPRFGSPVVCIAASACFSDLPSAANSRSGGAGRQP